MLSSALPSHASSCSNSGRSIHFPPSRVVSHRMSLWEAASNRASISAGVVEGSVSADGKGSAPSRTRMTGFRCRGRSPLPMYLGGGDGVHSVKAPHPVVLQVGSHSCRGRKPDRRAPRRKGRRRSPGEIDRRGVGDLLLHADNVVDVTVDHMGLLLGVAGVEHHTTKVRRESRKSSARTSVETSRAAPCTSSRASPLLPVPCPQNWRIWGRWSRSRGGG